MVQVIEREEEAAGAPCVVFHVYTKRNDPAAVLGAVLFGAPQDERAYHWQPSELGTPVAEAFERTLAYAESHGVAYVQVDDPRGLFPPERRGRIGRASGRKDSQGRGRSRRRAVAA